MSGILYDETEVVLGCKLDRGLEIRLCLRIYVVLRPVCADVPHVEQPSVLVPTDEGGRGGGGEPATAREGGGGQRTHQRHQHISIYLQRKNAYLAWWRTKGSRGGFRVTPHT